MATTTKRNLRKALSENIGDYLSLTATATGSANKDSWRSASILNLPGGRDPGAFDGWYVLDLGTSSNDDERRSIANYIATPPDPILQLQQPHSNATATDDAFEMHRVDPDVKDTAVAQALAELFPVLYRPIRDETLVVDSILLNGDFEDWTSNAPDSWTAVGTGTTSQETSTVFHGDNSLKLIETSGSAVLQRTQALSLASITEVSGLTATFKMRVWAAAGSTARIRLDWDGSSFENSDYHGGASEWELLSASAAVPDDATQIKCICEVVASGTGYFDTGWASVQPVYQYTVPTSIIRGPTRILQQDNEGLPAGPYYSLLEGEAPKTGRILRLEGYGVLSQPATESATAEVGEPRLRLVAAMAALKLVEILGERSASEAIINLSRRMDRWERTVERLSRQSGIRMGTLPVERFENIWGIGEDSSGRYINALGNRTNRSFTSN
jgi:hypothetical protein